MKTVLCPGTFDPITKGHADVALRAAALFDEVYLAVLDNIDKKTFFTLDERVSLAKAVFADEPKIKVIGSSELLADLAVKLSACAIVKGVRDASDFTYEHQLYMINDSVVPGLETVLLPASNEYIYLSSTAVRDIGRHGGDISRYVPAVIAEQVTKRLNPRK